MKLTWRQKLGPVSCHYAVRWVAELRSGRSIRLHHWIHSDDLRHAHDHAWWFISVVLCGSIIDRTATGDHRRHWLSIQWFSPLHRHSVVVDRPAWTLLLTGPKIRSWGYWVAGKFLRHEKFFGRYGHHDPCEQPERTVA